MMLNALKNVLCLFAFVLLISGKCFAGIEPYENFIKGQIRKNDTLIVKDEKFKNPQFNWANITNINVQNAISLRILDDQEIPRDFTCKVMLKVEYFSTPDQVQATVVDSIHLNVNYSKQEGANYKNLDTYKFTNGYYVKVTVIDISSPEFGEQIPPVLQLSSNIVVERKYLFTPFIPVGFNGEIAGGSKKGFSKLSTGSVSNNQLTLTWQVMPGTEEFDLEWVSIDEDSEWATLAASMMSNSPSVMDPQMEALFRNNATRITTEKQSYVISLLYNAKYIAVRMRPVQYNLDGIREEGAWSYKQDNSNTFAIWSLNWHEPTLNWQYSAAYAEEGKKKELISYFDGTLRGRQTVTLNNSDNAAVVQENIYDEFGRAAASILPAPVNEGQASQSLHFFRNFNRNAADQAYSFSNLNASNCEPFPQALNVSSGASKYYSNKNQFINNALYQKYIPDAEGYPMSVTQYTPDNTGRIKVQGGVGRLFQPGSPDGSHTTKYYYGKPDQWELDRLFGNDVGYAEHYLKNMVLDPNGQISVSYVNAGGKTIATALTGKVPDNVDSLTSTGQENVQTLPLFKPDQFKFDATALKLTATTTYLASVTGSATLNYDIEKLISRYPGGAFQPYSNCYYDLTITIKDDCNETVYTNTNPIQIGSPVSDQNAGGIHTAQLAFNLNKIGAYYITFEFALSKDVIERYTDSFISQAQANGVIKKKQDFVLDYLRNSSFKDCFADCKTAVAKLNTKPIFTAMFKAKLESMGNIDSVYDSYISGLYDNLLATATALQASCVSAPVSPCEVYRAPMLKDVSPGGQYAMLDAAGSLTEPQTNVLTTYFHNGAFAPISTALDKYTTSIVTRDDGSTGSPYDPGFSLTDLVKYWKAEWAEEFLQFHPEYCKLQFCNQNSASESWDEKIRGIDKASDVSFTNTNPLHLLATDPFFQSTVGTPFKDRFSADLNQYSKRVSKFGDLYTSSKNINQMVDFQLYCADQTAKTNQSIDANVWDYCSPKQECRVLDREWQLYRNMYLDVKRKYFELSRDSISCGSGCVIGPPPVKISTGNETQTEPAACLGLLDLSTSGTQQGEYKFRKQDASTIYKYFLQQGTPGEVPNFSENCSGISDTPVFYPCLTVKLLNNVKRYFYNCWLFTCRQPAIPCQGSKFVNTDYPFDLSIYPSPDGIYNSVTIGGYHDEYKVYPSSYTADNPPNFLGCANGISSEKKFYCFITFENYFGGINFTDITYRNVWVEACYNVPSGRRSSQVMQKDFISESINPISSISNSSNSCPTEFKTKIPRFRSINPDISGVNVDQLQNNAGVELHDSIASSCKSNADNWMKALAPGLVGKSLDIINLLRAKLIEICTYGGDLTHPMGSSSMPSGFILVNSVQCKNFGDVIKAVLGIQKFTNELNPWLLDTPYPYTTVPQAIEKTITNTSADICAELARLRPPGATDAQYYTYLQNEYGAAMKLTSAEFSVLLEGCGNCKFLLKKDITLPQVLIKGSKACITKTECDAAIAQLQTEFAGFSPTFSNYETIVSSYLNQKFGFSFSYDQYLAFKNGPSLQLCNVPPYTSIEEDPYACVKSTIEVAYGYATRDYLSYISEEKEKFRNAYIDACASAKANVVLTSKQKIYHYTLYYYDMAGNLVRTVPPEGVTFLTDGEMSLVKKTRERENEVCNYDGPTANSDKTAALQNLSSTIASTGSNAIELWMYSEDSGNRQVMATTPDKKYMFQACANGNLLNVDIYSLNQATADEITITLSNHITANINNLLPLAPWTHLVIQGASLSNAALQLWVNGAQYPAIVGAPDAGCGWSITSNPIVLPENLVLLKHLRTYSGRLMSASEISANAASSCLLASNHLAMNWYRFNLPELGGPTTIAENSTQETQYNGVYPGHVLTTTYAYNSTNQVVQQNTPDAGTSKFWYDDLSRLVASQNAKQQGANDFSYTAYDVLGRIKEVGQKKTTTSGLNDPGFVSQAVYQNFLNQGNNTQITQTIYDEQPAANNGIPAGLTQNNLRKRVAATIYRDTPASTAINATYYNYDIAGNVKNLYQQINGLGLKTLDYEYDLVSGKVNFLSYQHNQNDRFYYEYIYDAENRLIEAASSTSANVSASGIGSKLTAPDRKVDATYQYYLHGPLARMELGNLNGKVQGLDYVYTLQGWLKGVNGAKLGTADVGADGGNNVAKDALAYSLGYYTGDYKPIGGSGSTAFATSYVAALGDITGSDLYNGNISSSTYGIAKVNNGNTAGYTYKYDQLNRLLKMRQHDLSSIAGTWNTSSKNESYKEDFNYDGNGNILALQRAAAGGQTMDQLSYGYNRDGNGRLLNNKLSNLADAIGGSSNQGELSGQTNYTYDAIGNLIADSKEGITGIDWTVYGKIKQIRKSSGNIDYTYDPTGNRVSKLSNNITTWYVRDAQGNSLGVYDNTGSTVNWKEQQLYGSSRLGMWQPNVNLATTTGSSVWNTSGLKFFELNNHLSNVMAVINDNRLQVGSNYEANVISAQDYYAFGSVMPGRNFTGASGYRYGFNGKENDNEVKGIGNQQDYGMRIYDPRIGKFLSVDPISSKFAGESPYIFVSNNPIVAVDPDGQEKIVITGGADLHNKNRMNFILASKSQLNNYAKEVKNQKSNEKVSWLIFDLDYSPKEKKEFIQWAKSKGISAPVFVKSADEVVGYINSQNTKAQNLSNERKADQISDLSAFSHGVPSFVRFGYENTGVDIAKYDKTDFSLPEAQKLLRGAFIPNKSEIDLFSCNAATPYQNLKQDFESRPLLIKSSLTLPNLVKSLSSSTGATVTGYIGRTDYTPSGFGNLPVPGKTGGDYSPTVGGKPINSIKIIAKEGKSKAN